MKKIQVVMLEPGREAYAAEINGSLAGMQRIVDGRIEALYPFEEPVCMICNEEGKLRGLPLNRAIFDGEGNVMDIIAGTAFVCACPGEDFAGLSSEQLERYRERFYQPEQFLLFRDELMVLPL